MPREASRNSWQDADPTEPVEYEIGVFGLEKAEIIVPGQHVTMQIENGAGPLRKIVMHVANMRIIETNQETGVVTFGPRGFIGTYSQNWEGGGFHLNPTRIIGGVETSELVDEDG